jgi:hypothetical protein
MKKTLRIIFLALLAVLMLAYVFRQLSWTPPALGAEGDTRKNEIQVRDPTDITQVPPPDSFDEGPIKPIEPISPVGTDPANCRQVQHCDS